MIFYLKMKISLALFQNTFHKVVFLIFNCLKQALFRDFSGGPVARIHVPNAGGLVSISGQGIASHIL